MFALIIALAATILLTPTALAQDSDQQYYVWSSVVVQRTGERTPEIIGDGSTPVILTSIGANQAYEAGAWFRRRYIDAQIPTNRNGSNGAFDNGAPLWRLNADIYSNLETYAMALDQQWNVATATAFLQGLYPPASPGNSSGSSVSPTSWTSDNQYVSWPMCFAFGFDRGGSLASYPRNSSRHCIDGKSYKSSERSSKMGIASLGA